MEIITGSEPLGSDSRINALVEFYAGFNQRNLETVSRNWAQLDSIVMSNPLGGLRRGWKEIQSVYERLFSGQARIYVEFHDFLIADLGDGFVAIGRERGFCTQQGTRIELAIRTSRIFQMVEGSWKQIHHHGSIENPELLKAYQDALVPMTQAPQASSVSK